MRTQPKCILNYCSKIGFTVRNITSQVCKQVIENPDRLKPWQDIPGPTSLPIIGQLHHFLPGGSLSKCQGTEVLEQLCKRYGKIAKLDAILGRPPVVLLFDAESISRVLRGENWLPTRPGFQSLEYFRKYHKRKEPPTKPTGLVSEQGKKWKEFRSKVNKIMLEPKAIKLYKSTLDEVAEDMMARIRSKRDNKNMLPENFDVDMNLWSLEAIGVVALGRRLNCFDVDLTEESPARKLIQCVHDLFKVADELDFNKPSLWKYYPTATFKRAMKIYEDQANILKYFVGKSIEDLNSKSEKEVKEKSILEKLLQIDEEVAHIMASDMLIAGIDTVANTIIATLYLLATNQDKQQKLREELKANQETRPYLRACIKESMRMMPVTAGNARKTSKEYNLLGYKIPKDMLVTFGHQYLLVMDNYFPRPLEYLPERWLAPKDDPIYYGNAHPFAFNPFGFGVRSCIGRRIAELELEISIAKVIENFHLDWSGPPPRVTATTLNYITGPFHFHFNDV